MIRSLSRGRGTHARGLQWHLTHKKTHPPLEDPTCTVGLSLGPYGGPRGVAFSYERGTRVQWYLKSKISVSKDRPTVGSHEWAWSCI